MTFCGDEFASNSLSSSVHEREGVVLSSPLRAKGTRKKGMEKWSLSIYISHEACMGYCRCFNGMDVLMSSGSVCR
jgi:hypothetical protein